MVQVFNAQHKDQTFIQRMKSEFNQLSSMEFTKPLRVHRLHWVLVPCYNTCIKCLYIYTNHILAYIPTWYKSSKHQKLIASNSTLTEFPFSSMSKIVHSDSP